MSAMVAEGIWWTIMQDNMFSEMMYQAFQGSMSGSAERTIPKIKPKMKSIRTNKWILDTKLYAENKDVTSSTYPVYGGYNKELSVMLFDVICAITGSITFDNAVQTIQIMKNYVPKLIKPKKPKVDKPVPEQFQLVCHTCTIVRDIRHDFYKGRLICKSCFSKQVVAARK